LGGGEGGGFVARYSYRRGTEDKIVVCGKNETPVVRALFDCENVHSISFVVAPSTTDSLHLLRFPVPAAFPKRATKTLTAPLLTRRK